MKWYKVRFLKKLKKTNEILEDLFLDIPACNKKSLINKALRSEKRLSSGLSPYDVIYIDYKCNGDLY